MASTKSYYSVLTKCTCHTSKVNVSEYPVLKTLLPDGYLYRVCAFQPLDAGHFVARFRVKSSTKDEALAWFVKFQLSSCTLFNKDRTFPQSTPNIAYKVHMKCHHNTRRPDIKRPDPRHTRCPAWLGMTIGKMQLSYKSSDIHLHEFPLNVILHHRHNHLIDYDLEKRFLDRLKPPEFIPLMKKPGGPEMVNNLRIYIAKYNVEREGKFAELITHKDNFSAILVSPLMKTILECHETAEVLFADSIVKIEVYSCKLFLFLNSGGLPVGCILTTTDEEEIFDGALYSFKSFLNIKCFNGRGGIGPKTILTDEKGSGAKSFRKAFPRAVVSMCTYRVLQSMWKFIMNDKTGIPQEKRLDTFCLFEQMVNSSSKEKLARSYDNIMTCPSTSAYTKYTSYVYDMYGSRKEWAPCFRGKSQQVDHKNSWICESAMRMVHENISKWKIALSLTELFHCIASDIENFYENHLQVLASCRPIPYLKKNFKAEDFSSEKVALNSYIVRSTKANRLYCVNTEIGLCSCVIGRFGGMCKHRILASVKDDNDWLQPDPIERTNLHFIASEESDNFNTQHSKCLWDDNQSQEMSKNLNSEESDPETASSTSSPDLDRMSDDELEDVEMMVAYDNETSSFTNTFKDKLHEAAKERDNALESSSSVHSDVEPLQKRKLSASKFAENCEKFSYESYVSDSPDSEKFESMRKGLKAVYEDISFKMQKSNSTLQAVEVFIRNYTTITTCKTSLDSALRNFGRYSDSA